jgi:glycosidase
MPTTPIEAHAPATVSAADLQPRGRVHRSPITWRDQVLYFLLPDRFSDGQEAQRPRFDRALPHQHDASHKATWMAAGKAFQGGTLKGIASKLDYLQRLGATALWVGPVWRQRRDLQTYHGYGIQNFLDVDPRFGSRQDLRDLVDAAHDRDMYVVLDVIYNHTGNNWFYDHGGLGKETLPYRYQPPYPFHGWRSSTGSSTPTISTPDDGIWPQEFQDPDWYTRAGEIARWDPETWEDPLHPNSEFRRGDFGTLKDLRINELEHPPSFDVLAALVRVYQYWIALSDADGFRIDTVKHVSREASRNFCGAIREFAESVGKENFLLLGEVTGGGAMTRRYLDIFGRNLDAALDIGDPASRLTAMVKGWLDPSEFFSQFKGEGHDDLGSHRETGRYHVSILDDHDMVGRGKHRFSAGNHIANRDWQVAHAVGVQLTTLGIPCIYYGTEQAFDGTEARHDVAIEPRDPDGRIPHNDRYIREAMFGGSFGAFETAGCHFFDPDHPSYLRIAAIARIRNRQDQIGRALRRGRVYLRETSFLGRPFAVPGRGELVAWSRLLHDQEVLVALNASGADSRGADVTVHGPFHRQRTTMTLLYRSDWTDGELRNPPTNRTLPVQHQPGGRVTVRVDLPPAGMAILA